MGDKLGKMVNKLYSISIILFTLTLGAEENASLKQFDRLDQKVSIYKDAKIFTITGSVNNISLSKEEITLPKKT